MHALRDRNQARQCGHGAASPYHRKRQGRPTSAGLAMRPAYCKRLLAPWADSDVGSGIRRGRCSVIHTTWEYAWIRPPATSPGSGKQRACQATWAQPGGRGICCRRSGARAARLGAANRAGRTGFLWRGSGSRDGALGGGGRRRRAAQQRGGGDAGGQQDRSGPGEADVVAVHGGEGGWWAASSHGQVQQGLSFAVWTRRIVRESRALATSGRMPSRRG
jgi:hypothetical protein